MVSNKTDFHIETHNELETRKLGKSFGKILKPGEIVALSGPLGAGKTIFTKGIADALHVHDEVTSPTFTLIREYEGLMPLYHMDLYRISGPEEFNWLGTEELLNGKGICVIEWSENASDSLPHNSIRVCIRILESGTREIMIRSEKKLKL